MTAAQLITNIKVYILNPIIGLLGAVALALFIWGVVDFIRHPDNETERKKGEQHMLWGVVGLFIMVSVFGILNLICSTINCQA